MVYSLVKLPIDSLPQYFRLLDTYLRNGKNS